MAKLTETEFMAGSWITEDDPLYAARVEWGKRRGVVKIEPAKAVKTVGRNDPCPCESGKKFKKCCG